MSAEVESMAYTGDVPWHGLGVRVNPGASPQEMLRQAGLDWRVRKCPIYYGMGVPVSDKRVLIRETDGKQLDIVSKDWKPLQNHDALDFFQHFVDQGNMEMETAGSLYEGKIVWALAKITGRVFEAVKGDVVESYVLLSNPHQFGKSITVQSTSIRVVCQNTLNLALRRQAEHKVRVNHKTPFDPAQVRSALGVVHREFDWYEERAKYLATRRYAQANVCRYFVELFPSQRKDAGERGPEPLSSLASQTAEVLETQPGHEYGEGTYWQAFNAVTYVLDHHYGGSADKRMKSAWYGLNRTRKMRALELALQYADRDRKAA